MDETHVRFLVVITVPGKRQFPHPPFFLREEDPLVFLRAFHVTAHNGDASLCLWLMFLYILGKELRKVVGKELVAP